MRFLGAINYSATKLLVPENSFMHRMSSLEYNDGLAKGFQLMADTFKYETFPKFVESKGLSKNIQAQIPYFTDGIPVWNAFKSFFSKYIGFYYQNDDEIESDSDLNDFWEMVNKGGDFGSVISYGLPKLSKEALIDYTTHLAFSVTAWHEHVGTLVHYLVDLKGMNSKIRPGKCEPDVQAFIQILCLIGLSSVKMPMLMSNWKHLLLDHPKPHQFHDELMQDLKKISSDVDERNESRPQKTQAFNPKFFETSVSV